jgi:hypothetical protein
LPKKHLFLDVVTEEQYHVFGSLDEMLDADGGDEGGYYKVCDLNLGTPWPVGPNFDIDFEYEGEVTYSKTYWYYKPNEKYNEWLSAVEAKNRALRLRKIVKGRYKHMVRVVEKIRRKVMENELAPRVKFNFLNLLLIATSILGWDNLCSFDVLYGIVNLGICLGFS